MKNPPKSSDKTALERVSEFMAGLKLCYIHIRETSSKFSSDLYSPEMTIRTKIEEKSEFEMLQHGNFEVRQVLTVKGRAKPNGPLLMSIKCKLIARYESKMPVTMESFDYFRKTTICLQTWPYFREFVQDCTYRAGLPPLILPFVQVSDMSHLSKEPL